MAKLALLLLSFLLAFALLALPVPVQAGALPIDGNVRITDAGLGELGNADDPAIAVLGDTLYAVWLDDRRNLSDNAVYFAKSTDGGVTWHANQRISSLPYDDWPQEPAIAVRPDGAIYVIWHLFYRDGSQQVNDVRLAVSTDGGATFALSTLYDGFDDDGDFDNPQMTVDPDTGQLYILIDDYRVSGESGGYNLWLLTYDDATQSWLETRVNDEPRSGRDTASTAIQGPLMSLTARNGRVCVAWEDQRNRFAIYGACSTDQGRTFGPNVIISNSDAIFPRLALAPDSTLYATYTYDTDPQGNIRLRSSADLGATWQSEMRVTTDVIDEIQDWDMGVDANGQLVIAWNDAAGGFSSGNLWLTTSIDRGATFATRLVEDGQGQYPTAAKQFAVTLALSGVGAQTRAYLAWRDTRNTQWEIWSARFALDGIPPTAPANLQATAGDTSILLQWAAATDANTVVGYRVLRAASAVGPYQVINPLLAIGTTYRDVGLDATPYFYQVVAVDGTGNLGPPSTAAPATAQVGTDLPVHGVIAYTVGANVLLRDLPTLGNERTLAQGAQPHFASDGARLFFYQERAIQSRRLDGSDLRTFYQDEALTDSFDLTTSEADFASIRQRQVPRLGIPALCIVLEPHFGAPTVSRYTHQWDIAEEIAVAADGRWLAYHVIGFCTPTTLGSSTPPDFCLVDLATSERTCLEHADYRDPDFAPTGHWVAFAAPLTGQYEIWKAFVQAPGVLTDYTQLTQGAPNQPARAPAWSSDSNWIIFQRDVDPGAGADQRLFVVQADGAKVRALNVAGVAPAWQGGGVAPALPPLPNRLYLPAVRR